MNVQEVLKISKERKEKNKDLIKKIIENIHKKIKYYAVLKRESCIYNIPAMVDEIIIYDYQNAIKDIYKVLDSEGYIVTAYPNGRLDICWNENLVEQKLKADVYILHTHEKKLRKLNKVNKQIDERFSSIANPKKVIPADKNIDKIIDDQIEKILQDREKKQKKFAGLLSRRN